MHPLHERLLRSRRHFLTSTASGVGLVALASLLREQGLLAESPLTPTPSPEGRGGNESAGAEAAALRRQGEELHLHLPGRGAQPDRPVRPQAEAQRAQRPEAARLDDEERPLRLHPEGRRPPAGQPAQVQEARPVRHGACPTSCRTWPTCADDIALIRSMHTEAFNHHPGQLMMNTGVPTFGRPSMGSWLTYGLGSESKNLPGYVVLTAGRGTSGGASNWSSGFLPTTYPGRALPQPGRAGPEPHQPRRPQPTTCSARPSRPCAT